MMERHDGFHVYVAWQRNDEQVVGANARGSSVFARTGARHRASMGAMMAFCPVHKGVWYYC